MKTTNGYIDTLKLTTAQPNRVYKLHDVTCSRYFFLGYHHPGRVIVESSSLFYSGNIRSLVIYEVLAEHAMKEIHS